MSSNIQEDLFDILVRARKHQIVIMADTKRYRQVKVHKSERKFRHIVWRDSPEEGIKHFALNSITYGTKPTSFLATRRLAQISAGNAEAIPLKAESYNGIYTLII